MTIADHHLPETVFRLPVILLVALPTPALSTLLNSSLREITLKHLRSRSRDSFARPRPAERPSGDPPLAPCPSGLAFWFRVYGYDRQNRTHRLGR